VRRYGTGLDVLEAGCGTGLLLAETARVARSAIGLDLSSSMLGLAQHRGLHVVQGSLTALPLPDQSVDLVYSMKVLAHVPPIREALAELARVVRPGGHLLLEFYNPLSLRYLAKLIGGAAPIAEGTTDRDVYTRYDTLATARSYLPEGVEFVGYAACGWSLLCHRSSASLRWPRCSSEPNARFAIGPACATWVVFSS